MNRYGYELRHRSPASLVFERLGRPRWAPLSAPRRIVIAIEEHKAGGTTLTVYGTAPRAIRKAFAELAGQ